MNIYTLLFALLNTTIIIIYIVDSLKAGKRKDLLYPILASLISGLIIILLLNESINETTSYFILNFVILFSILPFYYIRNTPKLLSYLTLILIEFFYVTYIYGSVLYPFIQMLAIGTGFGLLYRSGIGILKQKHERASKSIETRRDLVHILLGVILLSLFLTIQFYYAVYITTTLILIGYIYNSRLGKKKSGRAYSILNSLERTEAIYGAGALYLGVGVALLLGFIHNLHFVIIGISALLLADPLATIVGVNTKGPKLFYNKGKSILGTLAFFATVSIIGYPFIGFYALLFGAGLAFIESVKLPIDDNITIPIVMIILYVIFLVTVNQLPF
jgi:dolichol kinase